ncbi:MAG: PLDc N-terminal domain-containing protein [Planctomycetaceae bacterium]
MTPYFILAQEGLDWLGFGIGAGIVMLLLGILAVIVWVWGLIDAATNPGLDGTTKIVWLLVIFFLPVIGTIAYLFLRPSRTASAGGPIDRPL